MSTPISGYSHSAHSARRGRHVLCRVLPRTQGQAPPAPPQLYKFDGSTWTLLEDPNAGTTRTFGLGGVSVSGTGASTRIALGVTDSWGDYSDLPNVQLSDDDGKTWREIDATMPHTPAGDPFWGWLDDVEIDPSNSDHVMYVHGGGVWETRNASSSTPSWNEAANYRGDRYPRPCHPARRGAVHRDRQFGRHRHLGGHGPRDKADPDAGHRMEQRLRRRHGRGPTRSTSPAWASSSAPVPPSASGLATAARPGRRSPPSLPAARRTRQPGGKHRRHRAQQGGLGARLLGAVLHHDNGATWVPTNLPPVSTIYTRGYQLAADRKNPNKVYAYDSGGNWWGPTPGKVYVSTDGGHTFTLCQSPVIAALAPNYFLNTSLVVNPNVEGDLWLADGNAVYHSLDSGATWTKLSQFASITGRNPWPDLQGATLVALGKAAPGATYSAAVYVVGAVNGVWGVYRSDDAGVTWTRFNDDAHQFGGIGAMAADQNIYGRIYVGGSGRGVLYSY